MNFFNYFFRSIPEKNNFILFGKTHMSILIIAFIVSYLIIKNMKVNKNFELLVGSVLLIQQVSLYYWYYTSRYNLLTEGLPLYHCRVAILTLALGLIFKIDLPLRIGTYWGIFGSIGALLLPGPDPFIFPHITQVSYFVGHLFLLWGCIYLLFVKKIGMTKIDLKNIFLFTNLYHVIVFVLNHKISSNYAYLRQPPFKINYTFNPYFYGFIVMMIFNIILALEYLFINKKDLMQDKLVITTL